ncbi:MAG: beta-ketoacyl-[acyl-carrier-protein] synthase II, partial [Chloroflexi bacterium]|nr:beta-ketoacyl-[acyl-carrier-protein] synthase II [Chloroflexota bacterium]
MPGRNGTRVVVTGMGAITPIGNSVQEFWDNAIAGKSGLGILQAFDHSAYPVHIAGEVKGFDPEEYMDRRVARRMGRFSQFAMAGTAQALRQADLNLDDTDRDRVGVLMGNGIGGLDESQKGVRTI